MSLARRVRDYLFGSEQKASAVARLFQKVGPGNPKWTPDNLVAMSREGYAINAVVYRCISILAKNVATTPWELMKGYGKTAREIDDPKHPLMLLLKRPNPLQGGSALFEAMVSYYLLHGNCYLEGVGPDSENAPPLELYAHRPDRIKIIPHPKISNMPGVFRYEYDGQRQDWQVDPITGRGPILHWKTFNPCDDWYGQSVIKAAAYAVDQHNAAAQWNQALLQNSGVPSGGLRYGQKEAQGATLAEEQRRQLQKDIDERVAGPKNAGRVLIMDGPFEWMQMGMTPADMHWIEGRKMSAMDICSVFGVPAQVYGIPDAQTFANYEQARLALWEETVIPLLDALADELNNWLVPLYGEDLCLRPCLDDVDALAPKRAQVWERVSKADWLTTNEKRDATGYDAVEDEAADEVLIDSGKTPLSMAMEPPADETNPEDPEAEGDEVPGKQPGKPGDDGGQGKPANDEAAKISALAAELKADGFKDDAAKALAALAYGEQP